MNILLSLEKDGLIPISFYELQKWLTHLRIEIQKPQIKNGKSNTALY